MNVAYIFISTIFNSEQPNLNHNDLKTTKQEKAGKSAIDSLFKVNQQANAFIVPFLTYLEFKSKITDISNHIYFKIESLSQEIEFVCSEKNINSVCPKMQTFLCWQNF